MTDALLSFGLEIQTVCTSETFRLKAGTKDLSCAGGQTLWGDHQRTGWILAGNPSWPFGPGFPLGPGKQAAGHHQSAGPD